jgi:hypothetical protein
VQSPHFAHLRCLHYFLNEVEDSAVVSLAASPHIQNLRRLSLGAHGNLTDAGVMALAQSPHLARLSSLSLDPQRLGRREMQALGRSRTLRSLRYFHLSASGEGEAPPAWEYLLGGRLLRRLRELKLTGRVSQKALEALASHPAPSRLWDLDLRLHENTAPTWESLLARGSLAGLTNLVVHDPPPGSLRALLPAGRLPLLSRFSTGWLPADLSETEDLLASPLARQLHTLDLGLGHEEEDQGDVLLRALVQSGGTARLCDLTLQWNLTLAQMAILTSGGTWPRLTSLTIDPFRSGKEGLTRLATWPVLRQLRFLELRNGSHQKVPGLAALARSPHLGPLLRVDLHNGDVGKKARAAIRARLGARFNATGRKLPRVTILGGWGAFGLEEDDD